MTVKEIYKEVFEDIKSLDNNISKCNENFKKEVLDRSHYPITKSYNCRTKEKKNLFIAKFVAYKRSDWKKPIFSIHGTYNREEGLYAVSPCFETKTITIYPPHFFKRYRERFLKNNTLSNEDIIKEYFENCWGFMGSFVNKDQEAIVFKNFNNDEKANFVAATSQGYCFGEQQGNVHIIKTMVTEDMLFESQQPFFHQLRKKFNELNKERYGRSI